MEKTEKGLQRTQRVQLIPDQIINELEDKQLDLCFGGYQKTRDSYRKKRFWPLFFSIFGFWLIFPPFFYWKIYRPKLLEWQNLHELKLEIKEIKRQRKRRKFFERFGISKNYVQTRYPDELRKLYRNLVQSSRQYNLRVGLFDHALERQRNELDPLFNLEEFEQIEETFQRLYNELNSAYSLFRLAEENNNLDLVTLLQDQYAGLGSSAEFIQHSQDFGQTGQFVHELLLLEAKLHQEINGFSQLPSENSDVHG